MKKKFKNRRLRSAPKQKILLLLCAGLSLGLTRSPRGQMKIIKNIPSEWRKIDRRLLYQALREFSENDWLEWKENADGTISAVATDQGHEISLRYNPEKMSITTPNRWDKKWRLVIYDIPDRHKSDRDALRHKLRELGFMEWQKSVFVHPYPCHDEIRFIVELFDVHKFVRQAEIINPTNEAELKLYFGLTYTAIIKLSHLIRYSVLSVIVLNESKMKVNGVKLV